MNFEDFTKDQQKAIVQKDSNIIVSAGAGSGKTAVLTQRVLHFIENEGLHLDQFLILTFTKLAAGEMKERIRAALKEKNLSDASLVDTSDITTFDAYALSIVKKYHTLLNVSPNVSIIDSNIISVKKRNIIKDVFEEFYTNNDDTFIKMISKYCFKDDDLLQQLTLKLHNAACLEMDFNEYLDTFIEKYYNEKMINEHMEYYVKEINEQREIISKLVAYIPNVQVKSKGEDYLLQDKIKDLLSGLFDASSYDDLVTSCKDVTIPRQPSTLEVEEKKAFQDFKSAFDKLNKLLTSLPQSTEEFFSYFTDNFPFIQLLIDIVKEVERRLREYKDSRSVYEFQDIAKMALELFRTNPEISAEIRNKLKMIMIDEYQDTSLIQESFIAQIQNDNVYMVGDIKQSIYRFRNAVCDIFKNKYTDYSNVDGGVSIDLNKNFRSRKEVLDDINYIFKQIMNIDMGGADYRASHVIEYGNMDYITKGSSDQNNNSTFLLYDSNTETADKVDTEINIIAKDIITKFNNKYLVFDKKKKVLRPCKFSDFCILLDRGTSFDDYVRIFNDYHIPLFVENDENISDNIVVKVLTNVIKLMKCIMKNEYDTKEFVHAYLSVARSFIYNYSDQELYDISKTKGYAKDKITIDFKNIINTNKDLSAYDIFMKIVFELNLYNSFIKLGDVKQNESYLDTFIDVFRQMNELDYTIEDFITYLKYVDEYNLKINLPSGGSTTDSVRLMNIHKSKGLEFSLVYFAGLSKMYNRRALTDNYGVSSKYGMYFQTFLGKENIIRTRNADFEAWEDASEKIRLFYVALTRTKEKMIFVCPHDSYNKETYLINRATAKELLTEHNSTESIFELYVTRKINYNTFTIMVKHLAGRLPYSFIKSNKKLTYTYQQLLEEINVEDDYINKAKTLIEDIRNDVADDDKIKDLMNEYSYIKDLIRWDLIKAIDANIDELVINVMKKYVPQTIEELYQEMVDGTIEFAKFIESASSLVGDLTREFYDIHDFTDIHWDDKFIKTSLDDKDIRNLLEIIFEHCYNNRVDTSIIKQVIEVMGYKFNEKLYNSFLVNDSLKFEDIKSLPLVDCLVSVCNDSALQSPDQYDAFNTGKVLISQSTLLDSMNIYEKLAEKIFTEYQKNNISTDNFTNLLYAINYETTIHFKTSDNPKELDFKDAVVHRGYNYTIQSLTFLQLIENFIEYDRFNREYADIEVLPPTLKFEEDNKRESYVIKDLNIDVKELYVHKSSKDIDINASYKNLEFGTNIHYLLELLDFHNPDYSYIEDDFYKDIVTKFMNCSLMSKINEGIVYKEYEFIDEDTDTSGIIDLLVVYPDHIDIIDYKTKDISDPGYDKQLKSYRNFIEKKFKQKVRTYLYSLLLGEIREVL